MPSAVLAHGAGDLGALGLPLPLLLLLGAGSVPALAGWLSARAGAAEARSTPARPWALPSWLARAVDARVVTALARGLVLAASAAVGAMAAYGAPGVTGNPAPRLVLIVAWSVLAVVSVLLGPVWRAVSPFRTVSRVLARVVDPTQAATRPLPPGVGVWPAAASLMVFAWMAEVAPPTPAAVLAFMLVYAAVQISAGLRYGEQWFAHGEAMEVFSTLLGQVAPVGRAPGGRPALASPLARLARQRFPPGGLAFLAVLLGWEAFHGLTGTERWLEGLAAVGAQRGRLTATVGLGAAVAVTAAALRVATPRTFLRTALIPLAAGWTLAHHVGPLLIETRAAAADLADPFAAGWTLYDVEPPPLELGAPGAIAATQLGVLLAGVLVAVVAAHRMAVARYDLRAARAVQFPFRAVLMAGVLAGVWLQAAAI